MADKYVWSGAVGAGTGDSWADAYTTLAAALNGGAYTYTNRILVASDHAETPGATQNYTITGVNRGKRIPIISVDRTDNSYKPGATINLTAAGGIIFNGAYSVFGVNLSFTAASSYFQVGQNSDVQWYDGTITTSAANLATHAGYYNAEVTFYNCLFTTTGSGSLVFNVYNTFFYNTVFSGAASSSSYYIQAGGLGSESYFYGCDFSAVTMATTCVLFRTSNWGTVSDRARFISCKRPTTTHLAEYSSAIGTGFMRDVQYIGGDNGSGNYGPYYESYQSEGNVIWASGVYRDNGSVDTLDSSLHFSHEMTPYAECNYYNGIRGMPIVVPINSTGSKTITVEIAHDFTTALKDTEFDLQVMYHDTTSDPIKTIEFSHPVYSTYSMDPTAAGTTLTTSTETWTGASGLTLQKVSKTITVNRTGTLVITPILRKYESAKSLYCDLKATAA